MARVKIKDLTIRIFYKFLLNQGIFAAIYRKRLIKNPHQNFMCWSLQKSMLFDWTAPWNFGAIALSSPPPPPSIVIDDSLKNAAESFTVALALTLEGG